MLHTVTLLLFFQLFPQVSVGERDIKWQGLRLIKSTSSWWEMSTKRIRHPVKTCWFMFQKVSKVYSWILTFSLMIHSLLLNHYHQFNQYGPRYLWIFSQLLFAWDAFAIFTSSFNSCPLVILFILSTFTPFFHIHSVLYIIPHTFSIFLLSKNRSQDLVSQLFTPASRFNTFVADIVMASTSPVIQIVSLGNKQPGVQFQPPAALHWSQASIQKNILPTTTPWLLSPNQYWI